MLNKFYTICAYLLLPLLFAPAGEAVAQVWHQERANGIYNVRSGSSSPLSLFYNPTATWNAASAAWNYETGDFHRPDNPAGKSELDLAVEELGSFSRFRTAGNLRYRNTKDFDRNWSSLIGNDPDNPYVICDTLADNSATERFDIDGALTWNFSDGWIAAGKVGLTTATLTDNKDPRPKNDISRIPITIGLERSFAGGWAAGVFGGAELFFSKFTNYLEYGQKAYRYYKMKGMGDFFAFSSSESSSSPREYSGATYSAGAYASLVKDRVESFTEAGAWFGNENARDGGSAYEWKAGDYKFTQIRFQQRLDIKGDLRQSIRLNARAKMTKGYWYDQKQRTDTEHGNITYYEIMSRYKNNDAMRITANAEYGIGKDADWHAALGAGFLTEKNTHYSDGSPCTQRWSLASINADGWKTFDFGRSLLDISAGAGYTLPVGKAVYASGNTAPAKQDISDRYVAPAFAYETSGRLSVSFRADWVLTSLKVLRPGLFVKGTMLKQMGSAPQSPALEGTSFCSLSTGAFLNF
ncbi:MAG: hypothetical protein J5693_07155 [Bacteroidales bacterium]|nr:hypothetical protein [Bacteroidales bacterium]